MNNNRVSTVTLILVATALALRSVSSQAPDPVPPEIHCKHFLYGYPLGTSLSNDLIVRDCYALSSNDTTKFPDWVCYYLTCHEVDGILDLERVWQNDPWLDPPKRWRPGPPARTTTGERTAPSSTTAATWRLWRRSGVPGSLHRSTTIVTLSRRSPTSTRGPGCSWKPGNAISSARTEVHGS
jgi:hypothetical protein